MMCSHAWLLSGEGVPGVWGCQHCSGTLFFVAVFFKYVNFKCKSAPSLHASQLSAEAPECCPLPCPNNRWGQTTTAGQPLGVWQGARA